MTAAPGRQQAAWADRVSDIGVNDEKEKALYCGSWTILLPCVNLIWTIKIFKCHVAVIYYENWRKWKIRK
jgi:hypothetical protein